ncbi:MAG: hypothetical protein JSW06_02500 [Thermoplasmatales archaeon]|nr:MAG: hypothetical protein JSW06_02500 [Thermoplasmatales archaeon]
MENGNLIKKGVVVAVIFLFIGLAFAPSINANISKASADDELVEFTTEVCGLNGGKHTVRLTKAEVEEVENLIDNIKIRLDGVETREEAVEIFNEAVVELDKYDLLGGLSVEQAQWLAKGGYQDSRFMKLLERLYDRNQADTDNNFLCLIVGQTSETYISSLLLNIIALGPIIVELLPGVFIGAIEGLELLLIFLWFISYLLVSVFDGIRPICMMGKICFGWMDDTEGWVYTNGLNGIKNWSGKLKGKIHTPTSVGTAVVGFTGIRKIMYSENGRENFFLGFARRVKIEEV